MNPIATTTPTGYWLAANGDLVPESKVSQIEQLKNELVYALCQQAMTEAVNLSKFKHSAMLEIASFCALSQERYKVKTGGEKGNVTLISYDGKFKIVRQMQDTITFGEELLAAKVLIDECVREWAKDANDNIKVLVNHAFQTDKTGKINTARVLALRQFDIVDERWANAMQAIADSMRTASSKPYIRFYKRDEKTMEYAPITLDVAAA